MGRSNGFYMALEINEKYGSDVRSTCFGDQPADAP
jgi:hypothetical protein